MALFQHDTNSRQCSRTSGGADTGPLAMMWVSLMRVDASVSVYGTGQSSIAASYMEMKAASCAADLKTGENSLIAPFLTLQAVR